MKKSGLYLVAILSTALLLNSGICYAKSKKLPVEGKGYIGSLPELTKEYNPQTNKEKNSSVKPIPAKDFNSENEIKPVPNDDPAFVNIILKKDKTSKYVNDLNEFIVMLENIYDLMEENNNVQLFNAKIFYFNKSVDYFRDKYANKAESEYTSYKRLIDLSIHARSVALLRSEALKYNPYLAYGSEGYIYNPNNIEEQLGYLKNEIMQTILLLRESE